MRECESPKMDAIVGIAFSCGPHLSSRKPPWEAGKIFRGGSGGEERNARSYEHNPGFVPSGGGPWGFSAARCLPWTPGTTWGGFCRALSRTGGFGTRRANWRFLRCPRQFLKASFMQHWPKEADWQRAGVGWAIFLRTEACLARRQGGGSSIESRGLALPPWRLAGVCCKSRCMATIAWG